MKTTYLERHAQRLRRTVAAILTLLMFALPGFAAASLQTRIMSGGGEEAAIRSVLSRQTQDWNERRLESFMEGYWKSPQLSFFSGGNKITGWDATLERYRRTYQTEGREMGRLAFSELDVELLGPAAAVVRGRFELTLSDGTKPTGIFTLIFRKFRDGWKIIHDHTSRD